MAISTRDLQQFAQFGQNEWNAIAPTPDVRQAVADVTARAHSLEETISRVRALADKIEGTSGLGNPLLAKGIASEIREALGNLA